MTARKREAGKNYIGLLHEEAELRVADISASATYPIMDPIRSLIAAMLRRHSEAR